MSAAVTRDDPQPSGLRIASGAAPRGRIGRRRGTAAGTDLPQRPL